MRAVNLGSLGAAEMLLKHGADTSLMPDEGFDLLSLAEGAEKNSKKMVSLLMRYGVNSDIRYYSFKIKMDWF